MVGCPIPHLSKTCLQTGIPSTIKRVLGFCTYNTNIICEPRLSKHRHILQIQCNTFNKQIKYSYTFTKQIINVCKCLLNEGVYLNLFHESLDSLSVCFLDLALCTYLVPGELPRSNTSPLGKTFHNCSRPGNVLEHYNLVRKECPHKEERYDTTYSVYPL